MDVVRSLPLDLALLDRQLLGTDTFAIADGLRARGVPMLLMSGYAQSTLPRRFRSLPYLEKPFTTKGLLDAVRRAAGADRDQSAAR